jgi:hypothetical protein
MKPNAFSTSSRLAALALALALCIGGLGYWIWDTQARLHQDWLEGMDVENFNETQMELWRWCNSVIGKLGEASDKIGDAMTFEEKSVAMTAFTPRICKYLERLRSETHRKKFERTQP